MPVGIDVDPQRLLSIVRSIEPDHTSEGEDSLVDGVELAGIAHGRLESEPLGHRGLWPRCLLERIDPLNCETRQPIGSQHVEPVTPSWIVVAQPWRLVVRSVLTAHRLTPELSTLARIRGVEHDLEMGPHGIADVPSDIDPLGIEGYEQHCDRT